MFIRLYYGGSMYFVNLFTHFKKHFRRKTTPGTAEDGVARRWPELEVRTEFKLQIRPQIRLAPD
jgi:hypothetical protein